MKRLWKCLLLAGVCLLLTQGTSVAQTAANGQTTNFFHFPTPSGKMAGLTSSRSRRADVIQPQRQRGASQNMFSRIGNFVWTLGGLRQVPSSPVTVPTTRRPF